MEIEILYDGQREMREAFTVHMKPDDNMVAEIEVTLRPYSKYAINKYKLVAYLFCKCTRTVLHICTREHAHCRPMLK